MYGDGRIVFDASDIDVKIHDRDERAEDPAIYAKRFDTAPFLGREGSGVSFSICPDKTHMRSLLLAFWKGNLEALDDKTLCASLDGFSFLNEADSTALDTDNFKLDLEDGEATRSGSAMDVDGNDDDSIQGNAYDDRDLGQDDVDIDDYSLAGDIPMAAFDDGVDDEAWGMAANGDGVGSDVVDAQVPVGGRTGGDLMTQLTSSLVASGGNDMYSYFDAALMRNWAGPLHWKVQRPVANARRKRVVNELSECYSLIRPL